MTARLADWGRLPCGAPIRLATLRGEGLEARVSSYGATLVSLRAPDRLGRWADVILGFDALEAYLAPDIQASWPYFGSTIGRYANRIAGAGFSIDGVAHRLEANEGVNQNHGGRRGFDRAAWDMDAMPGAIGVRLRRLSPAGEGGFPGAIEVWADMLIDGPGELVVRYGATTDAPTHVNLALHPYFNLAGRGARSVLDHRLRVAADAYLPIDEAAIPVGAPQPVAATPFDLRSGPSLGEVLESRHPQLRIGDGLNHCFVLSERSSQASSATLEEPSSGRRLEISTDQPGLQVYTANAFDGGLLDAEGRPFVRRQAVALETQGFPDSPNRPDFPSTLLRPGQVYRSETRFRLSTS